jgi:hypothetical protein
VRGEDMLDIITNLEFVHEENCYKISKDLKDALTDYLEQKVHEKSQSQQ